MRVLLILALVAAVTRAQVVPPLVTKPLFTVVDGFRPNLGRQALATADLNRDGYLDIAAPAGDGNGCGVRYGRGQGDFTDYTLFGAPAPIGYPTDIVAADVDRDGDLDLLVVRVTTSNLYTNDGVGRFNDGSQFAFGMPGIVGRSFSGEFADIDGDGNLDIVLGCDGVMRTFMGNGQGRFVEDTSRIPGIVQLTDDIAVTDMNGDGTLDIVAANGSEFRLDSNYVFFNDGTGRFFNYVVLPGGQGLGMCTSVGDIDGDQRPDILIARKRSDNLLLRNDGAGGFIDISSRLGVNRAYFTDSCLMADIDADRDNDLVIGSASNLHVLQNDGRGNFLRLGGDIFWGTGTTGIFGNVWSLHYNDLDNDGDGDLYVCQSGTYNGNFGIILVHEIYFGAQVHLWSTGFAPLGGSAMLRLFGYEGIGFLALAASRPTTHYATPFGALWLDPLSLVIDPTPIVVHGHGVGQRELRIPNLSSLRGRTLHMQALHFANLPAWSRLTNWSRIVIQ